MVKGEAISIAQQISSWHTCLKYLSKHEESDLSVAIKRMIKNRLDGWRKSFKSS